MRINTRGYGYRLNKTSTVKIRCINLVYQTIGAHWAYMWNTGWNPTYMQACVTAAASIGANCIKVCGNGVGPDVAPTPAYTDNYPDDVTFRARIQWFFNQCREAGLLVYWNLNSEPYRWLGTDGSLGSTNIPILKKLVGWLNEDGADILIAIDAQNEMNGSNGPSSWSGNYAQETSDLQWLMATCRSATDIPITMSVIIHEVSQYANTAGISMQYLLGCDFCDYHPYYQETTINPDLPMPQASDLVGLKANQYYVGRHFMGENGAVLSSGATLQTEWIAGLGAQVSDAQSLGGNAFSLTDFEATASGQFGFFDNNVENPRSQLITPFQAWPGWL